MSKKRLFLLIAGAMTAATLCAAACKNDDVPPTADTQAPVITVTGVPSTCNVGDTVTVPAATAEDNVDGDVSAKIKVTVSQMKADGETVNRDIIYEKAGNVEQTFSAASNELLNYRILYTVKDAAGNTGKAEFKLSAVPDHETGTLVIDENSVSGFTLEEGVKGIAGESVTLPAAIAIDQPDDKNISNLVEARLYEKTGDTVSATVFQRYTDFTNAKTVRIPAGKYDLVYSVKDAAGNEFEDKITVPVEIGAPKEVNLALDRENFALDDKVGLSWVNEFGEISFGQTSAAPTIDQTVGVTENVTKVFEQYVGVSFRADVPTTNGQSFFTLAARGSKNRTTMPDKETCTWPDYLFLRVSTGRIESRVARIGDKEMTTVKGFNENLLDGKNHTIYLQWKNVGESATDPNAAIMLYGWVDKTPAAGYDGASFIFKAVSGATTAEGVLNEEAFVECWNENTGAGWFSMDTYSPNRPHDDDYIRVKGLVIYEADETAFALDITAPDVSANFDTTQVYAIGEAIGIPEYTTETGSDKSCFVIGPDGSRQDVTGTSYTPTAEGVHQIVFKGIDGSGNATYLSITFSAYARDTVPPTITLSSEETLSGKVGDEIILPTATASDDKDGDITSRITIEVVGTEHVTEVLKEGDVYKYYPGTAGTQKVIYSVTDSFGNVTRKEITVNVASLNKQGNLLPEDGLVIANGGKGLRGEGDEWIYDQKVSMIANINKMGAAIQFNLRGAIGSNVQWPNGLVVKFNTAGIHLSARGHDMYEYGGASYELWKYIVGVDFLFEYQTENVMYENEEYIRVRLWIQGQELTYTADASRGGYVNLGGEPGIYRKVSAFFDMPDQMENIYSSPFWVGCHDESDIKICKLRIDGESFEVPAGPQKPDGIEKPTFVSGNDFIEAPLTTAGNTNNDGDGYLKVGANSNEDYIAVTFHGSEASKGAFILNVMGSASGWEGNLAIRLSQDSFELHAGNVNSNDTLLARFSGNPFNGAITDTEYTLVYKLTYVINGDYATGIQFDLWLGEADGTLVKVVPTVANTEKATYDAAADVFLINVAANYVNKADIQPADITLMVLGALNGTCDWTVTAAEKLLQAPGVTEVAPEKTGGETNVLVTSPMTWAAGQDTAQKAVENVGGEKVAVTFHYTSTSGYAMGINLLGDSPSSCWGGGLVLALTKDGCYLRLNGVNGSNLTQLKLFSIGDGASFTVAYRVTYQKVGDTVVAVRLDLWAGAADGTLTKIEAYSISNDNVSYDENKGAFIIQANLFDNAETPIAKTPDCTIVIADAMNGGCSAWEIEKVEILNED